MPTRGEINYKGPAEYGEIDFSDQVKNNLLDILKSKDWAWYSVEEIIDMSPYLKSKVLRKEQFSKSDVMRLLKELEEDGFLQIELDGSKYLYKIK